MKDIQRNQSKTAPRNEPGTEQHVTRRRAYQRPEVTTYDSKTIMQAVGPAHGVYGIVPGTASGGSL